jgi:hypothetical protein
MEFFPRCLPGDVSGTTSKSPSKSLIKRDMSFASLVSFVLQTFYFDRKLAGEARKQLFTLASLKQSKRAAQRPPSDCKIIPHPSDVRRRPRAHHCCVPLNRSRHCRLAMPPSSLDQNILHATKAPRWVRCGLLPWQIPAAAPCPRVGSGS